MTGSKRETWITKAAQEIWNIAFQHQGIVPPEHQIAKIISTQFEAARPEPPAAEQIPLAAIRDAAKLAASERNRWERINNRTSEHWESVRVALEGFALAVEVRAAVHANDQNIISPKDTFYEIDHQQFEPKVK